MANSLVWNNLSTLFTTTGPAYIKGKLEDTFFDAHPFFEKIKSNGGIKSQKQPGKALVMAIRVGANSTIDNRGTREVVPLAEQETVTTVQWPWGSLTGSMSFFDEDLHDNMGEAQLISLLEPALDQAVDTWTDILSKNILQQTSARTAFQFYGLIDAVTDGTWAHPGDYGGISDLTTYSGWKSFVNNNGGTLANLVDDMNHCFNTVTFGTIQPDMILTDQKGEELYRSAMDPNIRYTETKQGDATINAVTFRGRPVIFDRQVQAVTATPTGSGTQAWSGTNDQASTHRFYFLNSKYWEFYFDESWNFEDPIDKDWRVPVNQYQRVKLIALRGQLVCKQRRFQALLTNVPNS